MKNLMISKTVKVINPMHIQYLKVGFVIDATPTLGWYQVQFEENDVVTVRPSDCQVLEDDF